MYEFSGKGQDFVDWLTKFTRQGLWVVPLGDDQYQIVEPREWFCGCGRWVDDSPACAHGNALSPGAERKVGFFNYLMWRTNTVDDFLRECGTLA